MVRRTQAQHKTDELAFPIRLKFAVPGNGLSGLSAPIHDWLREHIGLGRYAVHSATAVGTHAIALYVTRSIDGIRFQEAFPQLQLADGTRATWYYSPYKHQVTEKDKPMDAETMIASAAAIADRLRRSLDNPRTEHVILTREEAALALGLVDGLKEVLEREVDRKGDDEG